MNLRHSPTLRVLLYSHDSWGLGHLRRSLAIAHAINRAVPGSSLLVATGSPSATAFPLTTGVDVLKLPSVTKDAAGCYQARQLNEEFNKVVQLRSALLLSTFETFQPDLLIVDHQLVGLSCEVLPLLQAAHNSGTHCVYGMRDVLDSTAATEAAWDSPECRWAFSEGYDEVWIYGDEQHFATAQFYPTLGAMGRRLLYTGLITNGKLVPEPRPSAKPHVLVTVGGGEDGGELLIQYLQSLVGKPSRWDSSLVTGPLLPSAQSREVSALAAHLPDVQVHGFHNSIPGLMRSSDLVLSMAGYNTCAELVASKKPAVLVPRTTPRTEQLIRAQYFERSGIAKCLVRSSPEQLYQQIEQQVFEQRSTADFPKVNGLEVVAQRCRQIASNVSLSAPVTAVAERR